MTDASVRHCLFLPCSAAQVWAVPKNCLAEIVTLYNAGATPPASIEWRGHEVPVLDLDTAATARWQEPRARTGLIAVLLGIDGLGCRYLGVALRGQGLGLHAVPEGEVEECPEQVQPGASGAFRWQGVTYQVPDLLAIQAELTRERDPGEDAAP